MEEQIKEVITALDESITHKLYSCNEGDLEANYWHFTWKESGSVEWNTYKFFMALRLYGRFCRRWEEHHNGPACVVERVRDKYIMPKIRSFTVRLCGKTQILRAKSEFQHETLGAIAEAIGGISDDGRCPVCDYTNDHEPDCWYPKLLEWDMRQAHGEL